MKDKVFLIYTLYGYDIDIQGYIRGTAEDAEEYCRKNSGDTKVYYEEINNLRES